MHIVELSEALRAEEKDFSFVSVDVVRLCQRPGIVTTWCVTLGIVSLVVSMGERQDTELPWIRVMAGRIAAAALGS